jgi:hypothetical protein
MNIGVSPRALAMGLAVSAAVGMLAGLVPGVQASRREIAASFRAV